MRCDVVDDCGPWVASAALEWDAAAFVLALEQIAEQGLLAEDAPLL